MNIRFQNAIARKPQETPPIWFMRQAGRYHRHYQGIRALNSFETMCKTPNLAAEVALGPIHDFDFDVSILFSDILFPLEGLGMGLSYTEQGPRLGFQLNPDSIKNLKSVETAVKFLEFQKQAAQATRAVLPKDKSLIGFVGGLWTLFVYAVEGSHAGSLIQSKKFAPELFPAFLEKMEAVISENIQMQLDGGVELVMIFDTAAGEVSPAFFNKYLAPSLERLAKKYPSKLGYYSKGTQACFFSNDFLKSPWAGMGVDHRWNLAEAFSLRDSGFIQGNFDQSLLFGEPAAFKQSLEEYLQNILSVPKNERLGWVCGLGHGVLPKTPEENVRYFVQRIREVLK